MTNVFRTPQKAKLKTQLFEIGVSTLEAKGYSVQRVALGKSSVRKITKDGKGQLVAIRTSQDRHIAFPLDEDKNWKTLSDVTSVVAVSVDDKENPKFALVHLIDANDLAKRFDRAYEARKEAGQRSPAAHALWLSLYHPENSGDPKLVGAGAGLAYPPIARVALDGEDSEAVRPQFAADTPYTDEKLSIAEAKRRLALTLGVDPSAIKITVEA